ncbi:RidA family protein [Pseudogemmobacter sonorensis]|uniref:RidA family protein n=1 Tax=Pseudogemmobacter sonorensis TaxID=2989681 RepID=UPI0036A1A5F6
MSTEIKRIGTGARMSEAVAYNGIVWLAGQVGNPGDSVADQTRQCLAEVDRILAEAGTDKTRILSTQIWLADMADFAEMNAVWDAWVPQGDTPARATGEAKLAAPAYKVEIIVTAALK